MPTLTALEFDVIRTKLSNYTKTDLGQNFALNLGAFTDEKSASASLALLSEAETFLVKHGLPPFSSSTDLSILIATLKAGDLLTPRDLGVIRRDIMLLDNVLSYMQKEIAAFPLLKTLIAGKNDVLALLSELNKVLNVNDEIKDNATNALSKIRKSIRTKEQEISKTVNSLLKRYESFVSENLVTMRDGHFVIPLHARHKNKVNGVIYDISNSGQTIFIEPEEIVTLNNDLINYQNEERIEINAILRSLARSVLESSSELAANNILLAKLDFLFAKVRYGQSIQAFVPTFNEERKLELYEARHPLIPASDVVSNTYRLSSDPFIIVISGPNAGGKTVSLKTIGLLSLMAKCGLMLPTLRPATLPFYENIYISIGDAQSLSSNLSTFSGHVASIARIINTATPRDLVLLDELGTGTSPEEGEALAIAVTNYLYTHNVQSVISSHYAKLKAFAYSKPGMSNASMAFSEEELRPLYKYNDGIPGLSYGLYVARRFGISEDVINEAKTYVSSEATVFEQTISALQAEVKTLTALKDELLLEQKAIQSAKDELSKQSATLKKMQNELHLTKKEAVASYILETEAMLDDLIKKALSGGEKAHTLIDLKSELAKSQKEKVVEREFSDEITLGAYVKVYPLEVIGKVSKVTPTNVSVVLPSGKTLRANKNQVELTTKPEAKARKTSTYHAPDLDNIEPVKDELHIIGMRVEEALAAVATYLDKCLLRNLHSVRIIHGFGTGALRRALHDYLNSVPFVKSYRLGGESEGAGGATVVSL